MADGSNQVPPGWHPDPMGQPGVLRYWDGARWTRHVAQVGGAPPAERTVAPKPPGHRVGRTIRWGTLGTFVLVVVVVAVAMLNGQQVSKISADGTIEFYSSGDRAATEPDVVQDSIESQQDQIDERVEDLEANAQEVGVDDPGLADFDGNWTGANGLTYVISQFGDAAVIEERTQYGTSAYGEGTVDGRRAVFFFTAFDGSQGEADLTLVTENRIEGSFVNYAFGTSGAVLTRN